jgi:uncharacterized membrane protein YfcA
MTSVLSLLPLLLAVFAYAAFLKFSARLFRRTQVSWRANLVFAIGVFLCSALLGALVSASGLSSMVTLLVGMAAHFCLVAWFFSRFARTTNGNPLNPIAAAKLTGVFLGLTISFFGGIWLLAVVLLRHAQQ